MLYVIDFEIKILHYNKITENYATTNACRDLHARKKQMTLTP